MKRPQLTQEIIDNNQSEKSTSPKFYVLGSKDAPYTQEATVPGGLTSSALRASWNASDAIFIQQQNFLAGHRSDISREEIAAIIYRAIREASQI